MNLISRGIKNTLRSPLRSGAIILMFAISIALVLSMIVARSSVQAKINEVKATAGTNITIRPAGVMGGMGGGDPLTAAQLTTIKNTANITATTMTLTDQLSSDSTSLEASLELGAFGRRMQQESSNSSSSDGSTSDSSSSGDSSSNSSSSSQTMPTMRPRITVTGTTNVNSVSTDGSDLTLKSGATIDASGTAYDALVGSSLATKNSLSVGSTFTMYDKTFTVKGIYETGNTFSDSGVIVPLTTLQTITNQADAVSTVTATVNSSDNVATTVTSLKSSLGSAADITSEVERAESSVSSLEGIASLALGGVIAAAIAGAAIILLAMIMIVRERRREIGVMKAIGGTDGKVVGQFIVEGFGLTIIGAIVGIVLGVFVSGPMTTSLVNNQSSTNQSSRTTRSGTSNSASSNNSGAERGGPGGLVAGGFEQLRSNASQVKASLTPQVFGLALGVTFLISLIGTAIPAWFTARIRPAEVLRTE